MNKTDLLNLSDRDVDKLIKIKNTQYNRARKLTDKQIAYAKRAFTRGKSLKYIADKLNVWINTIRYHVDEAYRASLKKYRSSAKVSAACSRVTWDVMLKDRADYKRSLVASRTICK